MTDPDNDITSIDVLTEQTALLETLGQLESLLIHAVSADPASIAPASRTHLLSLAHTLVCCAIVQAEQFGTRRPIPQDPHL